MLDKLTITPTIQYWAETQVPSDGGTGGTVAETVIYRAVANGVPPALYSGIPTLDLGVRNIDVLARILQPLVDSVDWRVQFLNYPPSSNPDVNHQASSSPNARRLTQAEENQFLKALRGGKVNQ